VELREVGPDDWRSWRELRLAALAEAPYAFGSALADWQGDGDREDRWRARLVLAGSHNVVALLDGTPVGMATGVPDEDGSGAELISMWVAPVARGTGVADALVEEVERWAAATSVPVLRLAVAEENPAAARLYDRHGFADTGRTEPMPDGRRRERLLEKRLEPSSPADVLTGRAVGRVVGLAVDGEHRFSKVPQQRIDLVEGFGVEGDAHAGATVQHRSHVRRNPDQPNLRQVHLMPREFFDLVREHGYEVEGGDLGENVLTEGIDLVHLPRDTVLRIGPEAVLRVTGLRNPCWQIDGFRDGLLKLSVTVGDDGQVERRTGIMTVVEQSGPVHVGDAVVVELPPEPHVALDRV
jgi:MOSC domain-containing protein YiiM/ribosomal protein S18 acetylase RimI-like enzyme